MIGKHIIINVKNIRDNDNLKYIGSVKPLFLMIIEKFDLHVVNSCSHQYGATLLYLLSESHLSCHTFVEEGILAMDLFTCNKDKDINPDQLIEILYSYFDNEIEIEIELIIR